MPEFRACHEQWRPRKDGVEVFAFFGKTANLNQPDKPIQRH